MAVKFGRRPVAAVVGDEARVVAALHEYLAATGARPALAAGA